MAPTSWDHCTILADGQVEPSASLVQHSGEHQFYLLDVRTLAERHGELGFIACTHHIELPHIVDGSRVGEIPRDRAVVIVCRSGKRAQTAKDALAQHGFGMDDSKVLRGGMIAWREAKLPTVSPPVLDASTVDAAALVEQVRDRLTELWSELFPAKTFSACRKLIEDSAGSYAHPNPTRLDAILVALASQDRSNATAHIQRLFEPRPSPAPPLPSGVKRPEVQCLYHKDTNTMTYVVYDRESHDALVIDPVLDFDPIAWQTSTHALKGLMDFVESHCLKVRYTLETHAHADHFTGSAWLKKQLGIPVAIGENIKLVQETFKPVFGLPSAFPTDGSQFDRLLRDGEELPCGSLTVRVIHTPGHTPACVSYVIGDAVFTGDALFLEDAGCGRCDFPRGSAGDLYHSIHDKLYGLPDGYRVFTGHDYQPGGRRVRWETTIGESKARNPQIRGDSSKEEFVAARQKRDATLAPPKLLFQSVQVNIAAGRLPESRLLSIPLNFFHATDDAGQPV